METIFCKNNLPMVIDKLQDYLEKGRTIKGLRLVDISESQVVLLIDEQPITQERAHDWWDGYRAAIG